MKENIRNILEAHFLIEKDAIKNWRFLVFIVILAMGMITNAQFYERRAFELAKLTTEVKEFRSEFVDRRSELMKLKMESTIAKKMEKINVFTSTVPPVKIVVKKELDDNK